MTIISGTATAGNDTIIANGTNDTIDALNGNDSVDGGDGSNTLIGGVGTDTVSYASSGTGVTVDLSSTVAQVVSASRTDTLSGFENIMGSIHADNLTGSSANNVINGGAGADTMTGGHR